jgi:hypothetical protein
MFDNFIRRVARITTSLPRSHWTQRKRWLEQCQILKFGNIFLSRVATPEFFTIITEAPSHAKQTRHSFKNC